MTNELRIGSLYLKPITYEGELEIAIESGYETETPITRIESIELIKFLITELCITQRELL